MFKKSCIAITRKGERYFKKSFTTASGSTFIRNESYFRHTSTESEKIKREDILKEKKVTGSLDW